MYFVGPPRCILDLAPPRTVVMKRLYAVVRLILREDQQREKGKEFTNESTLV